MKILFLGDFFYDYLQIHSDISQICDYVNDKGYNVILNLETTLGKTGKPIKKGGPNLRSELAAQQILKDLNVFAVTMANNHTMDFGKDALEETISILDELGIQHLGAGSDLRAASKPLIADMDNRLLIIQNYGWNVEETVYAKKRQAGCNPLNHEIVLRKTAALRSEYPDAYLINIYHWGFETNMYPMPMVFFASNNSKKLHPKMEKVASPFWRKLQAARQGCQSAAQTALQTYH